jgi:hypothetical protein
LLTNFAADIAIFQQARIVDWKTNGIALNQINFLELVEKNHSFNYQLWHAEDRARRDDMGFEFVYRAKREIDLYNQQRNNQMEAMDAWLFNQLKPSTSTLCPVHSETPGMMIDRLSILSLKAYHMELQLRRTDVNDAHQLACTNKLKIIEEQKAQLQLCLQQLVDAVFSKTYTFRVYHQFKMYNDPTLNPELY